MKRAQSSGPLRTLRNCFLWLIVAIFAIALLLVLFWPTVRAYLQAGAILKQLHGDPVPRLLRSVSDHPLAAQTVAIPSPAGTVSARLYLPKDRPDAPGLVLVPGIQYLGMDEPRLMAFAHSMAACGLRVLTPELPDSRDYRIEPSDVDAVGASIAWLRHRTGHRVGLMGLSFSGSLALMAAAQPPYSADVSFVFTVGAYDDLYRLATFYVTGADPLPNDDIERVTPNNYGPWILEYQHLEDFVPPANVPAIRRALRARLESNREAERRAVAKLTPIERGQYARLLNIPGQVAALAESNKKHAGEMAAISPHGHLSGLRAPVYLLHGRGDDLIPFAESKWLAKDLPPGTLQDLLVSPLIAHVTPNQKKGGLWDRWRLLHLLAQVMERAEAG